MTKYVVINNNIVEKVLDLDPAGCTEISRSNQLVVDVSTNSPTPEVGWVLRGNVVEPAIAPVFNLKDMITGRIAYYQSISRGLLRDLYAENTMSGVTDAESDEMFQEFDDVLLRIREGAWPTALYRLAQKQPTAVVSQAMIDSWRALLISRML